MQFVKRIFAGLLCVLLTVLCAACGQTEPTTAQSLTQAQSAADSSASVPESRTEPNTTASAYQRPVSQEPTQEDLENLVTILNGAAFFSADYDCLKDNVLDFLYDGGLLFELLNMEQIGLLKENENLFYSYSYDGGQTSAEDAADPLGHFAGQSFVRVKADALNACMETIFCNTVYKEHTISYDDDGRVEYYLHDGWYYFSWEISGIEGVDFRAEGYTEKDDGHLLVTVNEYWVDPGDPDFEELARAYRSTPRCTK